MKGSDEFDTLRSSGLVASVPVIRGTKVPLTVLSDYLKGGSGVDQFLKDYPAVTDGQLQATLVAALGALIDLRSRVPRLRAPEDS